MPRELFVEDPFADQAYADQALPIACGQTISQPYVVALMTEALKVEPQSPRAGDRHRLRLPGGGAEQARQARLHHRALRHARRGRGPALRRARHHEHHPARGRRHAGHAGVRALRPHHGHGRREGGAPGLSRPDGARQHPRDSHRGTARPARTSGASRATSRASTDEHLLPVRFVPLVEGLPGEPG